MKARPCKPACSNPQGAGTIRQPLKHSLGELGLPSAECSSHRLLLQKSLCSDTCKTWPRPMFRNSERWLCVVNLFTATPSFYLFTLYFSFSSHLWPLIFIVVVFQGHLVFKHLEFLFIFNLKETNQEPQWETVLSTSAILCLELSWWF